MTAGTTALRTSTFKLLFIFLCWAHDPSKISTAFQSKAPFRQRSQFTQLYNIAPHESIGTSSEENVVSSSSNDNALHQCQFCSARFPSRNALFRHIRSNVKCSQQARDGADPPMELTRYSIALLFGYYSKDVNAVHDSSEANLSGNILKNAIKNATAKFVKNELNVENATVEISGSTQASLAKLRPSCLAQEVGCAACGDVMVLRILAPQVANDCQRHFLERLYKLTQQELAICSSRIAVKLFACKLLSRKSQLHAERSCTQLVYHYLLPLQWLPDGEELEQWWLNSSTNTSAYSDGRNTTFATRPPSKALRHTKDALRAAESRNNNIDSNKIASGRFGSLAYKERRSWHNFADPKLRGGASPNNEPVWRVLDRARIIEFLRIPSSSGKEQVVAVIEFRGDGFVCEQIRRVIGTALAVTQGWLPQNTFDILTRPDVFVETALSPIGRLYLAEARFHFDEIRTSGVGLFETDVDGIVVGSGISNEWIHEKLLALSSYEAQRRDEAKWLLDLRTVVASRIRRQLGGYDGARAHKKFRYPSFCNLKTAPDCCNPTLSLLQDIVNSGKWPKTSVARSNIIRNSDKQVDETAATQFFGSFTVVNPDVYGGLRVKLPHANSLFPDLVREVFELERVLSTTNHSHLDTDGLVGKRVAIASRPSSSHCAVNCNAEFTPHVDSGRGTGQSLSMIIGLGDYIGGELVVEGTKHEIRYRPLEFDGWNLRHWTEPFVGERFSLVWFTPEAKGRELQSVPNESNSHKKT